MNLQNVKTSATYLVATNMIPLIGVLFFDWSIFSVVMIYWAESVVIGFWTVMHMIQSEGKKTGKYFTHPEGKHTVDIRKKREAIPFFIVCFGVCIAVYFAFILPIFYPDNSYTIPYEWIYLTTLGFFISHGLSYFLNYLGKGEYKITAVDELFIRPFGRLIVMHVSMFLGGGLFFIFGSPSIGVAALVLIKTLVDLIAHGYEHNKAKMHYSKNI